MRPKLIFSRVKHDTVEKSEIVAFLKPSCIDQKRIGEYCKRFYVCIVIGRERAS